MDANYISYESLLAARDSAQWAFWSMIGTWFSGIATFMAVCLTLYISNRRPKPKLQGTVSLSFLTNGNSSFSGVGINIANVGAHSAIITSLTWTFGSRNSLLQIVDGFGDNLPKRIEHGESAFFFIQSDLNAGWSQNMKYQISRQGGRIRSLKLQAHLATGDALKIKPAKNVIQMIEDS
ncbi:hypothetical protein [Citrobacter freundii]|uniref:hypothetical protein n=1 Tax=Citrobacter freundii TaxID=546 RepID=UPI00397ABF49